MKSKLLLTFVLLTILFTLTGCYDAASIEDSYYVVGLGIDLSENNLYKISIQLTESSSPSSSSGSESSSSSYKIYSVEAESIENGISILNNYLSKKINLSHCSAIIFSEELARKGLGDVINSLANNDEVRPNSYILISSENASDILEKVSNSGENFSSRFYEYIINSINYTGYSVRTTLGNFLSEINDDFGDGVLIYSSVNEETIQNNGLAIFRDDYMVGKVSALDSISHLLLTNKLEESIITIPNPFDENSKIDLRIEMQKNCDKKVEIINNTPLISCDLYITASIQTSGKNFDYTNTDNIKIVEKSLEKYLEKNISNYLYTLAKDYNSDTFNFQNLFSKSCKTNQELESYHWDNIYKESFFDVNVNTTISSTHLFSKE